MGDISSSDSSSSSDDDDDDDDDDDNPDNFQAIKIDGKIHIWDEHDEFMLYKDYLTLRKQNGTFYRGRGAPRASDYFYYVDADNLNVTYTLNRRNFEDNRRNRFYDSTLDYLIDRENDEEAETTGVTDEQDSDTDSSDDEEADDEQADDEQDSDTDSSDDDDE